MAPVEMLLGAFLLSSRQLPNGERMEERVACAVEVVGSHMQEQQLLLVDAAAAGEPHFIHTLHLVANASALVLQRHSLIERMMNTAPSEREAFLILTEAECASADVVRELLGPAEPPLWATALRLAIVIYCQEPLEHSQEAHFRRWSEEGLRRLRLQSALVVAVGTRRLATVYGGGENTVKAALRRSGGACRTWLQASAARAQARQLQRLTVAAFHFPPFTSANESFSSARRDAYLLPEAAYDAGVEVWLVQWAARHWRVPLHFLPAPVDTNRWGVRLNNGSWSGVMAALVSGEAQVALGGRRVNDADALSDFAFATPHLIDAVVWVVPRDRLAPRWSALFRIFKGRLWAAVGASVAAAAGAMAAVGAFDRGREPSLGSATLATVAILVGAASPWRPPLSSRVLSALFVLWAAGALQLNVAFQSLLMSFMAHPGVARRIRSEEELLRCGIPFGFLRAQRRLFNEDVAARALTFDNISYGFTRLVSTQDFACLGGRLPVSYLAPRTFLGADGQPLLQMLPDAVTSGSVALWLQRGDALKHLLDSVVQAALQGGLVQQWLVQMQQRRGQLRAVGPAPGTPFAVALHHVQGAFLVLAAGLATATAAFVLEAQLRRASSCNSN